MLIQAMKTCILFTRQQIFSNGIKQALRWSLRHNNQYMLKNKWIKRRSVIKQLTR